jgi:hypothetical protein
MSPNRYRKKPVEIEARQLTPETLKDIKQWVGPSARVHTDGVPLGAPIKLAIDTLEGTMLADFGDWILMGVKGEFYPCRDDIFRETYEPVDAVPALPVPWIRQTTITEVVREGAVLDDEQQGRVCDWLRANGIDPSLVVRGPITVVQPGRGQPVICFRQYDLHPDGGKYVDPLDKGLAAATFERHIHQKVPIPPQPTGLTDGTPS